MSVKRQTERERERERDFILFLFYGEWRGEVIYPNSYLQLLKVHASPGIPRLGDWVTYGRFDATLRQTNILRQWRDMKVRLHPMFITSPR